MLFKKTLNGLCDCHLVSPYDKFESASNSIISVVYAKVDGRVDVRKFWDLSLERPRTANTRHLLYAGKRQINTVNGHSITAINPSNQSGLAPLIHFVVRFLTLIIVSGAVPVIE